MAAAWSGTAARPIQGNSGADHDDDRHGQRGPHERFGIEESVAALRTEIAPATAAIPRAMAGGARRSNQQERIERGARDEGKQSSRRRRSRRR